MVKAQTRASPNTRIGCTMSVRAGPWYAGDQRWWVFGAQWPTSLNLGRRKQALKPMRYCFFAFFEFDQVHPDPSGQIPVDMGRGLTALAGLTQALVHTPLPADTPHAFPDDQKPPHLAWQLYADQPEEIEAWLMPQGALHRALPHLLATMGHGGRVVQQQMMLNRRFPTPQPAGTRSATYLVHYPGQAQDLNAWNTHYLTSHPHIMQTFPGIQGIEIYTRLDWIGGLPGPRVEFMQRNKVVFADAQALSAALLSPVIHDMRADFHRFPAFTGGNVHHPMATHAAIAG
jgi:hypothetical protein